MGPDLYWTYGFNIVLNSVLSFFTASLLLQLFMLLFRIKHPRLKVFVYSLPFLKLIVDFFLYRYSNWALLVGINPNLAEVGTRQLSVKFNPFSGIEFNMLDGKSFSLADLLALSIDPVWIHSIVILGLLGSLLSITFYFSHIMKEKKLISNIFRESRPIPVPHLRASLIEWMTKKNICLRTSPTITSPCIIKRDIFFPSSLLNRLSLEEIEAIIAHEIGHYRWKDSSLRSFCKAISHLFWWIPSKHLQRRLEEMQEQACDSMIDSFEISRITLAEAILKTAESSKGSKLTLTSPLVGEKLFLGRRIEEILSHQPTTHWHLFQTAIMLCSLCSILFGRLWIF